MNVINIECTFDSQSDSSTSCHWSTNQRGLLLLGDQYSMEDTVQSSFVNFILLPFY